MQRNDLLLQYCISLGHFYLSLPDTHSENCALSLKFWIEGKKLRQYLLLKYILPCTCKVIVALSVLAEPDITLVPVHVYTPSCVGYWAVIMCSVDIT